MSQRYRTGSGLFLCVTLVALMFLQVVILQAPTAFAQEGTDETTGLSIVKAEITTKGDLSLTFDKEMAAPAEGAEAQFKVTVNDTEVAVTGVEATNTPEKIKLVLEVKAESGETVTVAYTKSEDDAIAIAAADGTVLDTFDAIEVANELSSELLDPPALTPDEVNDAVGADEVIIAFEDDEAWRAAIKNIKVDGVNLEKEKYQIAVGKIAIQGSVFEEAKDYVILAKADGYKDAEATQKISEAAEIALKDVAGHWAEAEINQLIDSGVISGYPDGTFLPDKTITRAELVSILVKAFDLEQKDGKVFDDTASHWAKDLIATAQAHDVVSGYSDTAFGPDDQITREQLAVMIVRAVDLEDVTDAPEFADGDQIADWATEAVNRASGNQIILGYPDGTFQPKAGATRGQAAAVICRVLQ